LALRDDEEVRKIARLHAEERRHAALPLLAQRQAVSSVHVVADATPEGHTDFEAASEHDAVDLVLDAVGNDTALCDGLDAFSLRIHQRDVGAVESVQELVMEAR